MYIITIHTETSEVSYCTGYHPNGKWGWTNKLSLAKWFIYNHPEAEREAFDDIWASLDDGWELVFGKIKNEL